MRSNSPSGRPDLWISLARPDRLTDALVVAALCREHFAAVHLVYEHSRWWDRASWAEHRGAFATVTALPKVNTARGLLDLPRHYRDLADRQRRLRELPIAAGDVIVCLSAVLGMANDVASAYPQVGKILILTRKKFEDVRRSPDWRHYRHTTSSWFQYHLLEPLAGVRRTLRLKPRRKSRGDGTRVSRPAALPETVFQAVIVLSNTGREAPGGNVFASTFPTLRDGLMREPPSAGDRKRVVFFGTPFLLVKNLPESVYAPLLNRCLSNLRQHYGGSCDLIYRPHPAETRESASLCLDGFRVEEDYEVAQLYFLRHFAAIEAVYSVSSTVSRVALNYGMRAYAFWPCFPFSPHSVAYFQTLMDEVPPGFDVRSLETAPEVYPRSGDSDQFRRALASALDYAARGEGE